jgi:hypothetical protein
MIVDIHTHFVPEAGRISPLATAATIGRASGTPDPARRC